VILDTSVLAVYNMRKYNNYVDMKRLFEVNRLFSIRHHDIGQNNQYIYINYQWTLKSDHIL